MLGTTVLCCIGILTVYRIATKLNVRGDGEVDQQVGAMNRGAGINPQAPMWQLVQQQLGTMGQALQPSKENAALHLTRVRTQCVYGVQYAWLEKAMAKAMVIWEGRAKTEAGASPNVAENAEEDPPAVVNHHPGLHDKGTTKPYPPGEKAAGKRAMQWA